MSNVKYKIINVVIITRKLNYACPSVAGIVLIMSESPGSVIDMAQTLKYFPHAVPNSTLLPV